jgi:hypothetical protein
MPRLLHGLVERNARARGFGEIAETSPCAENRAGSRPAMGQRPLDHGVDALRIERDRADLSPFVDPPKQDCLKRVDY